MRNLILIIFLLFSGYEAFAQTKISELPSLLNSGAATDDVLPIVDTDVATTKKIALGQLDLRWLTSSFTSATATTGIIYDNEAYAEFQEATGNGDNYVRLKAPATLAGDYTLTLPADDGDNGECLQTDGAGVLSWDACGGGAVDSVFGRTGAVAAAASDYDADQIDFTPAGDVAATEVQAAIEEVDSEKLNLTGGVLTGDLTINAQNDLRLADNDSSNYVALQAPATIGTNYTLTFPVDDGANGQCLAGNGAGTLLWQNCVQSDAVDSVFGRTGTVSAQAGDYTADLIIYSGTLSAGDVEAALDELDADKADLAGATFTSTVNIAAQNELRLQDTAGGQYMGLRAPGTVTASTTLTLPDGDGGSGECLSTNGSGTLSWATCGGGGGGLPTTGGTMTGDITMDNETSILFSEADVNGSNYAELKAPAALGGNYTLTLPPDDGDSGECLSTDGSGTLDWAACSGGGGGGFTGGDFFDEASTKTANYTVLATDFVLLADAVGGAFDFTLPSASTNAGARFKFIKIDATFNDVDIGSLGKLNTQGESMTIVSDGTNWQIETRYIPSVWTSYTCAGTWAASGTNSCFWKRIGDSIVIKYTSDLTGAPSSNFNFDLPTGLTFDTARMGQSFNFNAQWLGTWSGLVGSSGYMGQLGYLDTNTVFGKVWSISGSNIVQFNLSPSAPGSWANGDHIWAFTEPIPITNWDD